MLLVVLLLGFLTISDYLKKDTVQSLQSQTEISDINKKIKTGKVVFGNISVDIEVSDTIATRQLGLSYRESLDQNSGMLFVFDSYNIEYFWMKDMKFPLDIIWIKDDTIVDISKNVPTPKAEVSLNQLPTYSPKEKVNYALEVNAGFADKNKVKVGDKLQINY